MDTTTALYGAFLKMRGAASEKDKQFIRADALVKLAFKEPEQEGQTEDLKNIIKQGNIFEAANTDQTKRFFKNDETPAKAGKIKSAAKAKASPKAPKDARNLQKREAENVEQATLVRQLAEVGIVDVDIEKIDPKVAQQMIAQLQTNKIKKRDSSSMGDDTTEAPAKRTKIAFGTKAAVVDSDGDDN